MSNQTGKGCSDLLIEGAESLRGKGEFLLRDSQGVRRGQVDYMSDEEYKFRPYVGPKYGTAQSVLKKRLLVLGASHYCDGCTGLREKTNYGEQIPCSGCNGEMTLRVIRDYFNPGKRSKWKSTHTKFYKTIVGDREIQIQGVVKSLIFYNYLQAIEGVSQGDKHPEKFYQKEIKERNEKCLERLLRELKPEVIIVWGANVRNAFPWELFSAESRKNRDKQFPAIFHCTLKGECPMNIDVCFSVHPSARKWFYMQKPRALFSALKLFDV